MFSVETFVTRRDDLRSRFDSGLVLFPGNDESPMNFGANAYPFRQDSSFLYYFGLDQPGLAAVIDVDEGDAAIFGNEVTIDDIVWTGDLPTISEQAAAVGVTRTRTPDELQDVVQKAVADGRAVHYLPPYRAENTLKLMGLLGKSATGVTDNASLELIRAVAAMRSIKTDEEIAQLEEAVDISVDMHVAAMCMARPGLREFEIAAEVERVARAAGGHLAYPAIATVHGETLHNHHYGNILESGDLFLLDAGAENAMHYAADLSSTFPVDTRFSERQKAVYAVALAAFDAAVAKLGPGVPNREVHLTAARVIAEGMKDLGLMKGDLERAVGEGAHALFFPCGVGHMIGLDAHDMEDLGEVWVGYDGQPKSTLFGIKSLRLARPLEPGFVLTVEPGVYFIPQLMDLWRGEGRFKEFLNYDHLDEWRDVGGFRNEENYLITESGARRLGKVKPKTIDDIEAIRWG